MASKKLAGKVAVVTGGNSGIGLASAQLFHAEGAKVAIMGRDGKTIDSALKTSEETLKAMCAKAGLANRATSCDSSPSAVPARSTGSDCLNH